MKDSKISWTRATFNPWWGCEKVSAGCARCYAKTFAKRVGWDDLWGSKDSSRRFLSEQYWAQPRKWNEIAKKSGEQFRVFCGSMCDVFEKRGDLFYARERLFYLIDQTPYLTWLLLTKRPQNMKDTAPLRWHLGWPSNVWALATAENQEQADLRVQELLKVPASIRGLSIEPMLEQVFIEQAIYKAERLPESEEWGLDWVICGGESAPGARAMNLAWARSLRDQCAAAGTAFYMKQMGGYPNARAGLSDIPADLRIREFPKTARQMGVWHESRG